MNRSALLAVAFAFAAGLAGCSMSNTVPSVVVATPAAPTAIYVADMFNSRIVRMNDLTGAGWQVYRPGFATLQVPTGVTTDAAGRIYINDQNLNRIVRIDDMSGAGLVAFGTLGTGVDQFINPSQVAVAPQGTIYIADLGGERLVKIDDMTGAGWATYGIIHTGEVHGPASVALDSRGRIYYTEWGGDKIDRIDDITGAGKVSFGSSGSGVGQFTSPSNITIDDRGRIYVTDAGNDRVVRIDDMTGAGWTTFGSSGSGTNQFDMSEVCLVGFPPCGFGGIAVDALGRIYVGDQLNNRTVRVNDMTGAGWTTLGALGTGVDQFDNPYDISVR